MGPKRLENRPQHDSQTTLKSIPGPLGELLELSWQPGGLLEPSWNALGALLEASGAQKTLLGSALGRPKGTKETGFALPEGQLSAEKGPRKVPKVAPKANQAENGETTNIVDCTMIFLDC